MTVLTRDENTKTAIGAVDSVTGNVENLVKDATSDGLHVHVVANDVATGGTSSTDDGAFTAGSGSGTPIMGFVTADSVDSGDVGVVGMDTARNLKVSIEADNVGIGGGTQYTEDAVAAAAPVGNAQILIRDDSPVSIAADGDNVARRGTQYGAAYSQIVDSSGNFIDTFGGGTEYTLGTDTYTETTTKAKVAGAVRNDTLASLVNTDNEIAPLQVNASGALYIQEGAALDVSAATVTVDLGANNDVTIDNSSIVLTEDAQHNSGDAGIMPLAVRNDALAALAGTDGDYAPLQVDADGALYTIEKNLIDTNNTTTSTLAGDAVYTGTGTDVLQYATLTVYVEASHDSATDGLQLEFSSDNSNWDIIDSFNYVAADGGIAYTTPTKGQYFRVVYTNGSTLQTHFRLQTILHANPQPASDGRLSDSVSPEKIANLTKSALIAQAAGSGDFIPIQSTTGGNLKISLEEASDGMDIGAGNAGTETLRVSISTDDVNLSAIKTAVEVIDNAVATEGSALGSGILLQGDDGTDRKNLNVDATTGDLQVDVTNTVTVDSELATAISLGADNVSSPTTAPVGSFLYGYDGSGGNWDRVYLNTGDSDNVSESFSGFLQNARLYGYDGSGWDRIRGDSTNGLTVNLGSNNDVTVTGDALTSLQLIDDVVYADDADWTADTSKHALVGAVTQATPTANTDGDTTPLITNSLREVRVAALESDLAAASTTHVHKYYSAATPTDGIIWSPAAGKRWYLTHLSINVSAASTVTIEDDKTGGDDPVYKAEFAANSGVVLTFPEVPLFSGEDAADLTVTATAGTVYITAVGYEI